MRYFWFHSRGLGMATSALLSSVWADTAGKKFLFAAENALWQSRSWVLHHPARISLSQTNLAISRPKFQPQGLVLGALSLSFADSTDSVVTATNSATVYHLHTSSELSFCKSGTSGMNWFSVPARASYCTATASVSSSTPSPPRVSRPSVTWGILQDPDTEAEARNEVFEYLKNQGINTSELTEIELPTSVEVVKDRLEFLWKIGLDNEAINNYPLMIGCSVRKNMIPVLDYLEKLGISKSYLPMFLKKYPMVLHASVVVDLLPVIDYLKGLDIDKKKLGMVLLRYPDVLGFKLEGTMSTSVAYLVSIGVNMREIGGMLTEYPEIMGMRVGSVIKPRVEYLMSLGIPKSIVARLLERRPQILGYDLENGMRGPVNDLVNAGVKQEAIPAIIAQFPEVLGRRVNKSLATKFDWLTKMVKVAPEDVPRIVEKLPQVIFIKENLAMERVAFLNKAGFSSDDVAKMVKDCPQLLAISIDEALKPSLNFLKRDMRRDLKEVVDFPAYFTYSLETRIRPRYELIAKKGGKCSLAWFLNCSDQKFQDRLEADYIDDEESGPVFQMGGLLPLSDYDKGKEDIEKSEDDYESDENVQPSSLQEHSRGDESELASSRQQRWESEDEGEYDDGGHESEDLDQSTLRGQENEAEESVSDESAFSDSWDEEDDFSDEDEGHVGKEEKFSETDDEEEDNDETSVRRRGAIRH